LPLENRPIVLLIDDDPSHLKLYGWIVERASFAVRKALVRRESVDLPHPESTRVDVVLMDYRLNSELKARDVAHQVQAAFPVAPIIVLSELPFMPEDARSFAHYFVTKGEPEKLLEMLREVVSASKVGNS
jgi:DNA-binding NtrC family response regulator